MMKIILLQLFCLLASCSATPEKIKSTTLVIVRHAEKLGGADPALSKTGQARARRLVRELERYGLNGVYTSRYRRAIETAEPAAQKFGLTINSSINPHDYKMLVSKALENFKGGVVLVVGHSNTVPALINSLFPSKRMKKLSEGDFSNLFIVKVVDGLGVSLKQLKY